MINIRIVKSAKRFAPVASCIAAACLYLCLSYGKADAQSMPDDTASLATLKAAVEANPDSLSFHKRFIAAFKKSIPGARYTNMDSVMTLLQPQYDKWIKQFPRSAIVPFAVGDAFTHTESPKAKPYLLEAVRRDSMLAQAWMDLSVDADRWGDEKAACDYMGKAAAAEPDNPGYAFYYAMDFEKTDPAKWRAMLYDLTKCFPESERGAQGLYWLAYRTKDPAEKIKVFEQLRQLYPPAKFDWSESGMNGLFEIYLKSDPQKAQALAQSLGDKEGWPLLDTLAQNFVQARILMSQHRDEKAADILRQAKLPRYPDLRNIRALQLAAAEDGAGHTEKAYYSLVDLFAKEPTDELDTAINNYAGKLNKDSLQVKKDIWGVRDKTTRPAPPFNLGLYTSRDSASLEDYKGKVILLTFWFPGCGPCRGEFPHFQNVINKFNGKNVVYLGINVLPEQDQYVLPFLKGTGYTFIPLRGNTDWAEKVYNVGGEPTNFLIDQQGRIVFTDFRIDGNNERTLELMINALLAHQ